MGKVLSDNCCLVKALKAGDETAFKALYLAYSIPLRRYASTILRDEEAAYEVVQDMFVAVWMNRKKLDESKSIRNYLLRAVHNNALRLLKYNIARKVREEKMMAVFSDICEEDEEVTDRIKALPRVLARLPEKSRKVLMMSFWEGKKNADIPEISMVRRLIFKLFDIAASDGIFETRKLIRKLAVTTLPTILSVCAAGIITARNIP